MKTVRRLFGIGFLVALGYAALRLYRQYQEDSAFDLAPVGNMGSNGSTPSGAKRAISKELLEILACPADKQPVELQGDDFLVCHSCGRRYPIEDGIPIMLIEEGDKHRDESLITH
jgi:uncharacterized protein YbaR (Trm112 family)